MHKGYLVPMDLQIQVSNWPKTVPTLIFKPSGTLYIVQKEHDALLAQEPIAESSRVIGKSSISPFSGLIFLGLTPQPKT